MNGMYRIKYLINLERYIFLSFFYIAMHLKLEGTMKLPDLILDPPPSNSLSLWEIVYNGSVHFPRRPSCSLILK